ncbi:MAG: GNAT family N-acetyltransferase [Pseudomonadota bacterium]
MASDVIDAPVVLAPAGMDEIPLMARFYTAMCAAHGDDFPEPAAAAKIGRMLTAPGQQAVLFWRGEVAVAYLMWADLGDHLFVRNYCVAEGLRGQGLGRALFERWRATTDGRPVRLETSVEPAFRFWQALGFSEWSTGLRTDAQDASKEIP